MKNGQFLAVVPLGSLNGQNGFKLDGENDYDGSGVFVDTAGDINGDGYDDLIIGADTYLARKFQRSQLRGVWWPKCWRQRV